MLYGVGIWLLSVAEVGERRGFHMVVGWELSRKSDTAKAESVRSLQFSEVTILNSPSQGRNYGPQNGEPG